MALEEQIVEWGRTRPPWQRAVLRRIAAGEIFADSDYDQLVEDILAMKSAPDAEFGLEQFPQAAAGDLPVRLASIEKPEHVNALASDGPLTFELGGLTIVYGDNGSGKSGYARLLKRITRSRHPEEVLSDVFRDTSVAKPTASLKVQIGDDESTFDWPVSTVPELQHMLFYDAACGDAYISTESDFPYRPSALFVMDGLIEACVAIRTRIDAKLEANSRVAKTPPVVDALVKDTEAGKYLGHLSGSSSVETLDALVDQFDHTHETIEGLKEEEARLRTSNASEEKQRLTKQAEKLNAILRHLESIRGVLGEPALAEIRDQQARLKALEEASAVLARSLESEPLSGMGSSPWKDLWEAARRFSEQHVYPEASFPVVEPDSKCVLCQQTLDEEAADRFLHFEQFVRNDTQVRLHDVRKAYDRKVQNLTNLVVISEAVAANLADLEVSHADVVKKTKELLGEYEAVQTHVVTAVGASADPMTTAVVPDPTITRIREAAAAARESVETLSNPSSLAENLAIVGKRRKELELLQMIKESRATIVAEIDRRKEHGALETAKSDAATGSITRKVLELSEENITEVVRDTFTRETDRLHLERVTIAKTRAERGALFHQPKLVGARQPVTLQHVFSEGERTALGLAAFFTEVQLNGSKSALILDDPVTSLDHVRRGLVASRLRTLAESRQVVVFTHDVSFVADLKREASGSGVPVAERSVVRSRAKGRRPGACTTKHPWKAKDVVGRIGELRSGLAHIKREQKDWDEAQYEKEVANWAGSLSETWERIFSQEIVGGLLAEGGLEVRPNMVKVLARFTEEDEREFQTSYSRISQWAKRHDKSVLVNYVTPEIDVLEEELDQVGSWFNRIKGYKK